MQIGTGAEIEIFLIRHGKTKGNLSHCYVGHTDEPLCEEGIKELEELSFGKMDYVFSSPMTRCIESAKILFDEVNPKIIEEFKEMNFGDFEMKNYEMLNGNSDYQRWIDSDGTIAFPNGESRAEFVERTMNGFKKLLHELEEAKNPKRVAIVAHGGTIMAIASNVLGGDYFDYQVRNGAYVKL